VVVVFVVAMAIVYWPEEKAPNRHLPPQDRPYPVRADWLVVNVPTGVQPSDWYTPGYPPLVLLDRPFNTLSGDGALLVYPVRSRMILDTRQVESGLRDEFGNVLTEMFGTTQHPTMPAGETLINQLKLDKKLEGLRQALAVKQKEAAAARANAKPPYDGRQAETLDAEANVIADNMNMLEARLKHLRAYIDEMQLDDETLKQGGKLFRIFCQHCHGAVGSGDALGGGRQLRPLPRDYRQGLFKFISTDPSVGGKRKPNRADLYRTIFFGTEEASIMPGFSAGLTPAQIQLVISYVIHLSIRGETEYEVMKKAADPEMDQLTRAEVRQQLFEQAALIAPMWIVSSRQRIVPDPNPYTTEDEILDSATRGQALFNSPEVGCATCHVDYGRKGTFIFDSWGSITRSRDLTSQLCCAYRVDQPEQLYFRIYGGMLGSNMPAYAQLRPSAADLAKGINKVWDLVNFVRYINDNESGLWPDVDLLYLRERQRLKEVRRNETSP
jgi:mono/diheme cytochrome c family protein